MISIKSLISFCVLLFLSAFSHASSDVLEKRNGKGSVVKSKNGLKWYDPNLSHGTKGRNPPNSYRCYKGPASNFPAKSTWVNFNKMWTNANLYALKFVNTPQQNKYIKEAILQVSKEAKVDARVILATILLESTGNLSTPCTRSFEGVYNCGIMQSYNARKHGFNPKQPRKSITLMVRDGVQGTQAGPGQVQLFNDAPGTPRMTDGNAYKVFRSYNSGKVNKKNLSDGLGATDAYVSNMANYLQGWNGYGSGPDNCNFRV